MSRGDLNVTDWRKFKTLSQSSVMVVNVLAVACFALPVFFVFSSSASTLTSLSSLLLLSSPLVVYPSFAHSVMD